LGLLGFIRPIRDFSIGYGDSKQKNLSGRLLIPPCAPRARRRSRRSANIARFLIFATIFTSYRFFSFQAPQAAFSRKGGGESVMAALRSKARPSAAAPLRGAAQRNGQLRAPRQSFTLASFKAGGTLP